MGYCFCSSTSRHDDKCLKIMDCLFIGICHGEQWSRSLSKELCLISCRRPLSTPSQGLHQVMPRMLAHPCGTQLKLSPPPLSLCPRARFREGPHSVLRSSTASSGIWGVQESENLRSLDSVHTQRPPPANSRVPGDLRLTDRKSTRLNSSHRL